MTLKKLETPRLLHRQQGMTTMGVVILVAFLGIFAFAGIRLVPVYLNYMKVASIVSGVVQEFDGAGATSNMIRRSISNRFDIEMVSEIQSKDVTVTKVQNGYEVAAVYSHKAPFIANISFVVDFEERGLVRR
ncbi:MAG: DUF4845 domain-containing protein [Woeseiaceae bacterium]